MGIVSRRPSIGTAASWFDGFVQVRDSTTRCGARTRWCPIDWARGAVFETSEPGSDDECRARHKRAAAVAGVALQDSAERQRPRLGHELSHHMGRRGGGQGRSVP